MAAPPYRPPSTQALAWVVRRCDTADVMRIERLVGGITADVDLVVLRRRDVGSVRVILRRWTCTESWTDGLVERESAALAALASTPVPAPRLLAADPTGAQAGVRCVLMSELPGSVLLDPPVGADWLQGLAESQAEVHRTPAVLAARCDGWFDPHAETGWIADPTLRRDALDAASVADPGADHVFAHGDFQPFNVLWRAGRPSGVVDWPNAGSGPRGVDVGHCTLNIAVLHGPDAAVEYLRHYEVAAGVRVDAGLVLRALLVWSPDWLDFIPMQVAGRVSIDVTGMRDRVVATVRRVLELPAP